MNASKLGSSALSIVCKEGTVVIAEKRLGSNLIERSGFDKVNKIDNHVYCVVSGLIADA